ncbi:MAG TPA: hypothetical protein VF324_00610, partial [Methanobacterium sp.]
LSIQKFLSETVKDKYPHSYQRIISHPVSRGLAKQLSGLGTVCEILPDGRDMVKDGGYIKYVEKMVFDKQEAERLKKIESEDAELKLNITGSILNGDGSYLHFHQ